MARRKREEILREQVERYRLEIQASTLKYQAERVKKVVQGSRHFEAGSLSKQLSKWRVPMGSGPNSILRPALRLLRERSRDIVRNSFYGESASNVLVSGIVGTGIMPSLKGHPKLQALWKRWAGTTMCDITRVSNFTALQSLLIQSWVENGEVLFQKVYRDDWRPGEIPFAIKVLEPDYIDDTPAGWGTNYKLGVKINKHGAAEAYRLFTSHPYDDDSYNGRGWSTETRDVKVAEIGHLYWRKRPGQLRGIPPFTPILLRTRGQEESDHAELTRQKIGACFAAFITNIDGENPVDAETSERIEPGTIQYLQPGENVAFTTPPVAPGYSDFKSGGDHAIAAGLGLTYEDLTGDYSKVNWSSGRLAKIRYYGNLDVWQWQMFVPQVCEKIFGWFLEAAAMLGYDTRGVWPEWTVPRRPIADPNEFKTLRDEVRAGFKSLPEAIRENGFDPDQVIQETADFNKKLDKLGLVFDSDARKVSNAGQTQPDQIGKKDGDDPDQAGAAVAQ